MHSVVPKSCFHYDSLFRFLNHPANRVSFGMVCDLDTDFLLLADDIVVDFCLLAMRMGLLEESDCSGSEGLPRSFPDLAKSDLCTIKSFSSCCLWTRRSWDDTDLLRLGPFEDDPDAGPPLSLDWLLEVLTVMAGAVGLD